MRGGHLACISPEWMLVRVAFAALLVFMSVGCGRFGYAPGEGGAADTDLGQLPGGAPGTGDVDASLSNPTLLCDVADSQQLEVNNGSWDLNDNQPTASGDGTMAQSLRISSAGTIAAIDIAIKNCAPNTQLVMHLFRSIGGAYLGATTLEPAEADCGSNYDLFFGSACSLGTFDLRSLEIGVEAGDELSFLVIADQGGAGFARVGGNPYRDGSILFWVDGSIHSPTLQRGAQDVGFRVFVY